MPWLIRACSLGHAIHSKRRVTEVAQTSVGAAGGKGDHRAIGPDVPKQLCCPLTKPQGCRHMAASSLASRLCRSQHQRSKECVRHFIGDWEKYKKRASCFSKGLANLVCHLLRLHLKALSLQSLICFQWSLQLWQPSTRHWSRASPGQVSACLACTHRRVSQLPRNYKRDCREKNLAMLLIREKKTQQSVGQYSAVASQISAEQLYPAAAGSGPLNT